jgi:hypothetical protein
LGKKHIDLPYPVSVAKWVDVMALTSVNTVIKINVVLWLPTNIPQILLIKNHAAVKSPDVKPTRVQVYSYPSGLTTGNR